VARNDSVFRDANERIKRAAEEHELVQEVPFICECADPRCTHIVSLTLGEYEEIRSNPRWFLNAVGHDAADGDWGRAVARREGWMIVEKLGQAGAIATQLDSRDQVPKAGGD
jgi:hypothetical protein